MLISPLGYLDERISFRKLGSFLPISTAFIILLASAFAARISALLNIVPVDTTGTRPPASIRAVRGVPPSRKEINFAGVLRGSWAALASGSSRWFLEHNKTHHSILIWKVWNIHTSLLHLLYLPLYTSKHWFGNLDPFERILPPLCAFHVQTHR